MGTQWTLGGPPSPSADNASPRWLQFFDGSRSNRPYAGNKPAAQQDPPNQPTQSAPEILQPPRCFIPTGGANWGAQPVDRLGAPQRIEHHARLEPGGRRLPLDIRASPSVSLRARRGLTPGCQNRVQLWRATLESLDEQVARDAIRQRHRPLIPHYFDRADWQLVRLGNNGFRQKTQGFCKAELRKRFRLVFCLSSERPAADVAGFPFASPPAGPEPIHQTDRRHEVEYDLTT